MFSLKTWKLICEEEIRLYHGRYVPLCSHNSPIPHPSAFEPSDPLYDVRHRNMRAEQKSSSGEPAEGRTFRMIADFKTGKIWYESSDKKADVPQSQT